MNYFRFGNGPEPLVILPGLSVQSVMGSAELIASEYKLMDKDFTVYVFDRRSNLPPTYSVREMAGDTAEAIEQLSLKDINLYGASQGGMMAMVIAAEHPELVKKAVLGSTACRIYPEQYETIKEWIRFAKDRDPEGLYLSFGEKLYPPELFAKYRSTLLSMAGTVTDSELDRFIILAEAAKDLDLTDDIKKIECPVLVMGSYDDNVLGSRASDEIVENLARLPGLRSYMYENYGHAVYDTAPDFRRRMYDFLVCG